MLYSHNGDYPKPLPNLIRLSNGMVRTDSSSYTAEEIADAGYIQAPEQPLVSYPGKLEWSGTDWIVRDPNELEILDRWNIIKQECKVKLAETDYRVIKSYELSVSLDQEWINYRQAIRDIYNNTNSIDPWNFFWPNQPLN